MLAGGGSRTCALRLGTALSSTWLGRHRAQVARGVTALAVAAGLVVAVQPLRSGSDVPLPPSPVTGVAIRVPPPVADGGAPMPIRATYRVQAPPSGGRVTVDRVTGPFFAAARDPGGPASVVTVSAVASCADPASLDTTSGPHRVELTVTGVDGRRSHRSVLVAPSPVDWAAAVRQDCWQRTAARGIEVVGVQARGPGTRQLLLTVRLRNTLPRPVQLWAVDIADVDTIDAADTGVLEPGASRAFTVRLPVADCAVPVLPLPVDRVGTDDGADLVWSVGPAGGDPAALFVTRLPAGRLAVLRGALLRACAPVGTRLRVVGARVLPPDRVVVDHTGVSIALRLAVTSDASQVALGQQQTALTADARTATTAVVVRLSHHRGSATIIWRARCSANEASLVLPVQVGAPGQEIGYSVVLAGRGLVSAHRQACGRGPRSVP